MSDVPELENLLEQAMKMQQQLVEAQGRARAMEVQGEAGGGVVVVTMTGGGEVTKVRIDPSVVDPADVELLEDLLVAAIHAAAAKAQAAQEEAMGPLGGLGGLSGLGGSGELGGLGGLGGLLGGDT
jgi:DNA-binding YbaB/EbfC family protein